MIPETTSPADRQLAALLRVPGAQDHKYTRGVLGVWAGSQSYPGAAVLTCAAAVRSGVGMVRLLAPERVVNLVLASRPEVVSAPGRCQAVVIGPGTDPADAARAAELQQALALALGEEKVPVPAVIDAGALPLLAAGLRAGGRCNAWQVLTPHAGEAAALLSNLGQASSRDEVEQQAKAAALELSALTGATVLLKGTPTLVANQAEGVILSLDSGPGWLATAGSGDVLAGVLGALLASASVAHEGVENLGHTSGADFACSDLGEGSRAAEPPTKPLPERYETALKPAVLAIPTKDCHKPDCRAQTPFSNAGSSAALLAALAVRIHARSAEIAAQSSNTSPGHPIAALDLVHCLPQVLGALLVEMQQSRP
ncbi:Nicotinamide nucleotide repair protein [Actinomyces bovis]|uniref:ADP-dependent (S)-NAD(P)H-hydrate dehydratase n=1 Tax=Actinomyces bovis TaxID=1658 RepID=A0ABY1VLA9_9ACTO|nr:ADP/ATP-dependent (S)-NAD(P)H-hydrate dehydratase [Actinomyces bovis]SPT52871.1 Nicotinamide nucleotide repair protein [Actinomyces bovis]VEG54985.1 Nicotinamide nucleotide repair protein [Actinomyces israelii]